MWCFNLEIVMRYKNSGLTFCLIKLLILLEILAIFQLTNLPPPTTAECSPPCSNQLAHGFCPEPDCICFIFIAICSMMVS